MSFDSTYKYYSINEIEITNGETINYNMRNFHFHDHFEIYFTVQNGVKFLVNNNTYSLKEGDILVLNNNDLHRSIAPDNGAYERKLIEFRPEYISYMSTKDSDLLECFLYRKSTFSHCLHLTNEETEKFLGLFSLIEQSRDIRTEKYGASVYMKIYLAELLLFINGLYRSRGMVYDNVININDSKLEPLLKYIQENYNHPITVDNLANSFYLSKPYIFLLFKKITGDTPNEYIKKWRILKACDYLKHKDFNISQISEMVGFKDISHFVRTFRQIVGITPGQYAKINRM